MTMKKQIPFHEFGSRVGKVIAIFALGFSSILISACNSSELIKVGDPAPEFTLSSETGLEVSLSDYQEKQPVLLYFHMAKG
jgi:hypothetical protein